MTTKRQSAARFRTLNRLVDEWFAKLTNAEISLLVYYFRHAKVKYSKPGNHARDVFQVSDGRAARDLGRSKQAIAARRQSLARAGIIHAKFQENGRVIWYIGDRLPSHTPYKGDKVSLSKGQGELVKRTR